MTAFARIILVGKNSDMGKIIKLPVGVGVDGSAVMASVRASDTEYVCRECAGFGYDEHGECERCHGDGTVDYAEDEETERDDGCGCPPASSQGSGVCCVSSLPTNPAMPAVSRATGALSHPLNEGTKHTEVLRSVLTASHSPAAPPVSPRQGALEVVTDAVAVVAGLSVLGMVAFFLLVIQ